MANNKVSNTQKEYYGALYKKYKYSPKAVASAKQIYKELRYEKLSRIFEKDNEFTIHDVGMGLGHYYEYLKKRYARKKYEYSGTEVVKKFCEYCKKRYPEAKFCYRDIASKSYMDKYDYLIFGGTFYHPCNTTRKEWEKYMFSMLKNAFAMANKGIAFNCITELCDYYERGLYYCNIAKMINYINDNLSRYFIIEHAYPLYELTVYVYRESHIKKMYPHRDFNKYFK